MLQNESNVNSGSYQLFIRISKKVEVNVGRLGLFTFESGDYIYTGSAMRNLSQRVTRHMKKEKTLKWHIDYLLSSKHVKIISYQLFPSLIKEECSLNQSVLNSKDVIVPVPKFGSSDCKSCPSHLLKIK